jgi:hypothetical protein
MKFIKQIGSSDNLSVFLMELPMPGIPGTWRIAESAIPQRTPGVFTGVATG